MNKDIRPRNDKNQPHGLWECYFHDGTLMYKGNYVNGKRYDYWESYYGNDKLQDKNYYI